MKTKVQTVLLYSILILIVSCQKKMEIQPLKGTVGKNYLDNFCLKLMEQENDSVTRNLYFKIAVSYYELNSLDDYLKTTKKVYELASKKKDTIHIAKSLYYLGDYYEAISQLDSAFSYYSKSERAYNQIKDSTNSGKTKLYKAGVLLDAGIFSESEIEAIGALRILSKGNNTRLVYECYNLIGISLKELNNCKESLKYFDFALKQLEKLERENYPKEKIEKSRISCFNNIGRVYEKQKKFQEAILYYERGLLIKNIKQLYPKSYAMLLDNLGYSKLKTGNHNGIKKNLLESLKISDSLNFALGSVSSKINLGEYYLFEKDTSKALAYLKDGFKLSQKIKSSQYTIQSLKLLMENDSKNKSYYSNIFFNVSDSIQNVERITRNKFARIAYETDQIEVENQLLVKQNTYVLILSIVFAVFFVAIFLIYRLKSKNKELLFIKDQQEANEKIYQLMLKQQLETEKAREEERNRIAMELLDGIVNSVFTTRFNLIQLDSTQLDKKEQLVKELEKTENEIRRVSHDLTQNLLFEDKNIADIIAILVESQQNQYNTKFDVSIDKYIDWSSVSSDGKVHIYRIIQEAIQNINKHSNADKCYIMLLKTKDKITIRIWDNGIGFITEKVKYGFGLKNITERTKMLKGDLKVTSEIGKGVTIEVVF